MPGMIYSFGPFRLDVFERRLLRMHELVPMRGKIFDTLRILVENHGRLVRKGDLMKALWPDSIVEENNLDQNLSSIRKALGQRRGVDIYVETVPRHGYRFVAPVKTRGTPQAAETRSPDRVGTGGPAERLAQIRIAFENASAQALEALSRMEAVACEPPVPLRTLRSSRRARRAAAAGAASSKG